jgi:hypothetical protein
MIGARNCAPGWPHATVSSLAIRRSWLMRSCAWQT